MFKIKYIESEYVQTSGSALLKMMQNNTMPVLDLFVRESIQNSLDAGIKDTNGNYLVDKINVDFQTGQFETKLFSKYYKDVSNEIENKFTADKYDYIAIRDSNTIGLVGNRNGKFKKDGTKQNLGKLVFQIMHPQDQEGAGGSWGIGKTIYYRLGQGFTIFYSRIKLDNGTYEERLVSSLVEDEENPKSIMSKYPDGIGIAFFGDVDDDGCNVIINQTQIHSFLNIFNITPFINDETGTLVIIPFIDTVKLLNDNKPEIKDEYAIEPFWYSDICDYLKYSILRWYLPRMSKRYPYGAYLNVSINGVLVELEDYDYIFKKYFKMYECILDNKSSDDIKVDIIERKRDLQNFECGKFAYCKVSRYSLGMNIGSLPSPYVFMNLYDVGSDSSNPPLITYTRKPGMLISYKTEGDWAGNGVSCGPDEFILGLFVLNSTNIIKSDKQSLEEYIRKGEKSDHIEWYDHALESGKKIDVVRSITRGISSVLKNKFLGLEEEQVEASTNRVLGKRMARVVLPDHNFGKDSSKDSTGRRSEVVANTKMTRVKISDDIVFDDNGIKLKFFVTSKGKCKSIEFVPQIATSNGYIKLSDWIKDGLKPDLLFDYAFISISKYNYEKVILNKRLSSNDKINDSLSFELITTNNIISSCRINVNDNNSFEFNFALHYKINNKNTSLVIKSIIEESE